MEKFDIRKYRYVFITLGIVLLFGLVVLNAYKYIPSVNEIMDIPASEESVLTEDDEDLIEDEADFEEDIDDSEDEEVLDLDEEFEENTPYKIISDDEILN